MTRPTDDKLEAMAMRLEDGRVCSPAQNNCRNGYMMLEAAAMLRACKGRVRVKPLVWVECSNVNFKRGHCFTARSLVDFAPLAIHKKSDGWWLNKTCETYPTLEDAKAAAQADYEARILAAIDPAPDHSDWNAAIEAAAKEIDCYDGHMCLCGCDGGQSLQHACPKNDVRSIRTLKKGSTQ